LKYAIFPVIPMEYNILMKKSVIFFLLASTCHGADLEKLIPALIAVESRGNNHAIGDSGKAVGCLQIWPIMVEDVNRISHMHYTFADRYDREKSIEMCRIYLNHYATNKPDEYAARIWNGGPQGYKKDSTKKYWEKVKRHLK